MRILSGLFFVVAIAGLLLAIATFPMASSYEGKAKLVQRMRIDDASALFGEAGTPVGSPQKLIIDDPKAFSGSKTPEGAEIVDEGYLEKNKIYPLQLQTVTYVTGLARIAGVVMLVVSGFLGWFLRKRSKR